MPSLNLRFAKTRIATAFALFMFAGGALASAQTERTIFKFNGTSEGSSPEAGLIADSSGALYGTTPSGWKHGSRLLGRNSFQVDSFLGGQFGVEGRRAVQVPRRKLQ